MVAEQDEEDDKLRWRVDAEVQAAVAEVRQATESSSAELRAKLLAAEHRAQGLRTDLATWEAAVAERDAELRNLQVRARSS